MKGKQADSEQRSAGKQIPVDRFSLSVGKHVVKQKRRKLADTVWPKNIIKTGRFSKENSLFLNAEDGHEPAISGL